MASGGCASEDRQRGGVELIGGIAHAVDGDQRVLKIWRGLLRYLIATTIYAINATCACGCHGLARAGRGYRAIVNFTLSITIRVKAALMVKRAIRIGLKRSAVILGCQLSAVVTVGILPAGMRDAHPILCPGSR